MVCASCGRRAEPADRGAQRWKLDSDLLNLSSGRFGGKGCVRSGVEQQKPGAGVAAENRFHPLAIEPARNLDRISAAEGRNMRVDEATEPVRHGGGDAREARTSGGEDDGGVGRAAKSFRRGSVRRIARLGKGFAGDGQQVCSS